MNAYRLRGRYLRYSKELFSAVILSDHGRESVKKHIESCGWAVKSLSMATRDDIADLPAYDDLVAQLETAVKERAVAEAAAAQKAAEQRAEQVRLQREAVDRAIEMAEQRTQRAAHKVWGDVESLQVEDLALDDETLHVIRAKLEMLLGQKSMARDALHNAIFVDAATFLGRNSRRFPIASKLITTLTQTLTRWMELRNESVQIQADMRAHSSAADANVRAIASRTYTYGGSGIGFLLSASAADDAVHKDEMAIQSIRVQISRLIERTRSICTNKLNQMAIMEFRLHAVHRSLFPVAEAPQKPSLPREIVDYVTTGMGEN
jgi:integrase